MRMRVSLAAGLTAALAVASQLATAADSKPGFIEKFKQRFKELQEAQSAKEAALPRTLEGAVSGFLGGRAADAEAILKPLAAEKKKDNSFALYGLALGSVDLSLGDYQSCERSLFAALANMGAELSTVKTGFAMLQADSSRPYRGFPHEKMLAHTYLGLAFFQQSKYEDARIEFAQAREAQKGSAAGQEDDFVTGHFLEGMNFLHRKEYNDAQVSFRKVTELQKEWPLGWFALCRASDLAHGTAEADEAWSRYEALAPAEARMARDGSTNCVLFLVESGRGPHRETAGYLGQWKATDSPEIRVWFACSEQSRVEAPKLDDLYFQASTSGGVAGEATRKLISLGAKSLVGSLFKGDDTAKDNNKDKSKDENKDKKDENKDDVDLRCWATTPAALHLAAVSVPAQPSTVELTCSDKAGKNIESLRHVMRFLRGRRFEQAPVVYERILPNAASRAGG